MTSPAPYLGGGGEAFEGWGKVYKRFNAWSASGKWLKIFQVLVTAPDMEWVFIDGSYVKAHEYSAGAACGKDEAIGEVEQAKPARFT
jgi:transposase